MLSNQKQMEQEIILPSIKVLGKDLLYLTKAQKVWTITKPFLCCFGYFYFASNELWILAILSVVILMFVTYVSTSHDLVHGTLKLHPGVNRFFLSIIEILTLRSGHAFKVCHINHHRNFPKKNDIEGASIHMKPYELILESIIYLYKLFFWARKHAKTKDRIWIHIEGSIFLIYIVIAILLYQHYPFLLYYFLLVQMGSWLYPLFTVYIPHKVNSTHPIFQTKLFRGPIISFFFAHHNYHLEHHLYPMVPHQNWRKLGKRLLPYLKNYNLETINL